MAEIISQATGIILAGGASRRTAFDVGFSPVKINVVVMNGVNSDEIPDFVSLARRLPVHVRFIELMPIVETGFFNSKRWLPGWGRRCAPRSAYSPGGGHETRTSPEGARRERGLGKFYVLGDQP